MWRFVAATAVAVIVLVGPPGVSWGTDGTSTAGEVVLTGTARLRPSPSYAAATLRILPQREADGVLTPLMSVTAAGASWVHVSDGAVSGWLPRARTVPISVSAIGPWLAHRLSTLATSVSGQVGIVVSDRAGHLEWSLHPYRASILASNAKLFVTGLAAHRDGHIGPELSSILLPSDNLKAQQLYDAEGGAGPVERFARSLNASVTLVDGSGLSRSDVASPLSVDHFLIGMSVDPHFGEWLHALPVAGVSGTLSDRMVGTAAQGRCHAKTGTLSGVSALSGYCTTLSGHQVVFSILMSGVGSTSRARSVQDQIAIALVKHA